MNPGGGKVARAQATSPLIDAGNVFLPHPQMFPWVMYRRVRRIPNGAHDDQVDAMTQVLLRWHMALPQEQVIYWSDIVQISPY